MTKNILAIEVDRDDQILVESVCIEKGYTFYTFFKHLLTLYKDSLNKSTESKESTIKEVSTPEQVVELEASVEETMKNIEEKKPEPKKFRKK